MPLVVTRLSVVSCEWFWCEKKRLLVGFDGSDGVA